MQQNGHEKRMAKIEANCVKLKEQIMQLEFQNKKDIAAAQKRFDERQKRADEWEDKFRTKLDHIAKLAGLTYEELDNLDLKLQDAGKRLSLPRKRSTLV
jgi:fructose-1,6-bisphosphatase